MTLTDTLDDLISDRRIEPQLALKIVAHFDKAVSDVLNEKVKNRMSFKVNAHHELVMLKPCLLMVRFKGHLSTYRFCDDVWTFILKNVIFKPDNSSSIQADRVKIVSCNTKRPGET